MTTISDPYAHLSSPYDTEFAYDSASDGTLIICGAPWTTHSSWDYRTGRAYIFNMFGTLIHTLENPDGPNNSEFNDFGVSVAIDGSYAVVSTSTVNDKVHIFDTSSGSHVNTIEDSGIVSISGNYITVGGNVYRTLLGDWTDATLYLDTNGNNSICSDDYIFSAIWNQNKIEIYDKFTTLLVSTVDNPNNYSKNSELSDSFGISLATEGNTLVVGSHGEFFKPENERWYPSGVVYVFNTSSGDWTDVNLLYTLEPIQIGYTSFRHISNDRFGHSVAIEGDNIVVGAPYQKNPEQSYPNVRSFVGTVYMFSLSTGEITKLLYNPSYNALKPNSLFGFSVFVSGNNVITISPGQASLEIIDSNTALSYVPDILPVASDDFDIYTPGVGKTVDVLANDTNGDAVLPATVKLVSENAVSNGKILTVPGEGVWTVGLFNGRISFASEPGFRSRPTPVTYQVEDAEGNITTAKLHLTPAPIASDDEVYYSPGLTKTVNVLENDTVGDTVVPSSIIFTDNSATNNGKTLIVSGEGEWSINPANGEITFTPENAFLDDPTPVEYQVTGEEGLTDTATLTLLAARVSVISETVTEDVTEERGELVIHESEGGIEQIIGLVTVSPEGGTLTQDINKHTDFIKQEVTTTTVTTTETEYSNGHIKTIVSEPVVVVTIEIVEEVIREEIISSVTTFTVGEYLKNLGFRSADVPLIVSAFEIYRSGILGLPLWTTPVDPIQGFSGLPIDPNDSYENLYKDMLYLMFVDISPLLPYIKEVVNSIQTLIDSGEMTIEPYIPQEYYTGLSLLPLSLQNDISNYVNAVISIFTEAQTYLAQTTTLFIELNPESIKRPSDGGNENDILYMYLRDNVSTTIEEDTVIYTEDNLNP